MKQSIKSTIITSNDAAIKEYSMDSDNQNNDFYNSYAEELDKIPFGKRLVEVIPRHIKSPSSILDIGAGSGALAKWLTEQGHTVTCLEPAIKAAERARSKGLEVHNIRLQDYQPQESFDAVIAISSLIHIPCDEIADQLQKIALMIKPHGCAIMTFLMGLGENHEDPTHKGRLRFFSKFTHSELLEVVSKDFSIEEEGLLESRTIQQSFCLLVLKPRV